MKGVFPLDLRQTIAENLATARKNAKITQAELAEKLNYSDKAISKWERGESVPDVLVLKEIADLFSVSVDYFLRPHTSDDEKPHFESDKKRIRLAVTLTSCIATLFIAVFLFVIFSFIFPGARWRWKIFVSVVPVMILLTLIFNAVWFKQLKLTFLAISGILWSVLATAFVYMFDLSLAFPAWVIFLIGIPLQIIILAWAFLFPNKGRHFSDLFRSDLFRKNG